MSTYFTKIALSHWRQFVEVSIDLHPRLTIITGANGAGKSTILNIFSSHYGWSRPLLSLPKRKKGGGIEYDMGFHFEENDSASIDDEIEDYDDYDWQITRLKRALRPKPPAGQFVEIGNLSYSNGVLAQLGVYQQEANQYGLSINNQQQVAGVPIGSHRFISNYQPVQGVTLGAISVQSAYDSYFNEVVTRLNGGISKFPPVYRMKEALIGMAAFGEGNSHLESNSELLDAFNGFSEVLRKVLPVELGFKRILIRIPDIVLKTRTGDFVIDSSSGGISAVIEIAWQIFLYSRTHQRFSVTLDEPENHLHPSMQRSILANLIEAFPLVQFIVATHSPFIVSAVEDSRVFALQYVGSVSDENGLPRGPRRVRSIALDDAKKAGTASDILKEVLGVSVSIPRWAENRVETIVERYQRSEINVSTLKALRTELKAAGFADFYPEALSRLVKEND